jgi:hypothetical protein
MVKNKLAFPNTTDCENILKKHYNISQEKSILIKNIQTDPKFDLKTLNDNSASDRAKFDFYHPDTKEKLDMKICSKVKSSIKIPFKDTQRLRPKFYEKSLILKGVVDIYDNTSPGYTSRCLKSTEFDTGGDTSINFRRNKLYQNESINCSENCEYEILQI